MTQNGVVLWSHPTHRRCRERGLPTASKGVFRRFLQGFEQLRSSRRTLPCQPDPLPHGRCHSPRMVRPSGITNRRSPKCASSTPSTSAPCAGPSLNGPEPLHDLRPFYLKVCWSGKRTFHVRVAGKLGRSDIRLDTVDEITAAEARARALDRDQEGAAPSRRRSPRPELRRAERRWKPSTRQTNRDSVANHILPFFGGMRVADTEPSDVRRWFDGMSERPATANRSLPALSVMMKHAKRLELRQAGSTLAET